MKIKDKDPIGKGGRTGRLFTKRISLKYLLWISRAAFLIFLLLFLFFRWEEQKISRRVAAEQETLLEEKKHAIEAAERETVLEDAAEPEKASESPKILPEYQALFEENSNLAGWLRIPDTVIDYPVMQTPEDENYYLTKNFWNEDSVSGCLVLDTDSNPGTGCKEEGYPEEQSPSTNLIIHGHTMKSGEMFGGLKYYEDPAYGEAHKYIRFDSLYEKRTFELIAVFYSQVYRKTDQNFKYYQFFQADTQEEFDDWYNNIKKMSLYDTGVTAEWGDEFITLSCCAYHTKDGRFVVVGKRI